MATARYIPKVGDLVKWDGSGDGRFPRIYHGTVKRLEKGYAIVEDNEWHADNGVAFRKLAPWNPEE